MVSIVYQAGPSHQCMSEGGLYPWRAQKRDDTVYASYEDILKPLVRKRAVCLFLKRQALRASPECLVATIAT